MNRKCHRCKTITNEKKWSSANGPTICIGDYCPCCYELDWYDETTKPETKKWKKWSSKKIREYFKKELQIIIEQFKKV